MLEDPTLAPFLRRKLSLLKTKRGGGGGGGGGGEREATTLDDSTPHSQPKVATKDPLARLKLPRGRENALLERARRSSLLNRMARAAEDSLVREESLAKREGEVAATERSRAARAGKKKAAAAEPGTVFRPSLDAGLERFCANKAVRLRHASASKKLRELRASAGPGEFAELAGPEAMRAEREAKAGLDPLLFASLVKGRANVPSAQEEGAGVEVEGWPPRPAISASEFQRLLADGRALLREMEREEEKEEQAEKDA